MTAAIKLPEFDLEVSVGGRLSLEDLRGRRSVLYFYPKDDTGGCTIEAHEFTELHDKFLEHGVEVYGVSPDSMESHAKFVNKCEIGVPLISDPDKVLCTAFEVWKEKSLYGKTYMGVERSTFMLSPDLEVEHEWRQVAPLGHAREVLDSIPK